MAITNPKALHASIKYIPMVIKAIRDLNGVAKAVAVKQRIAETLSESNQDIPDTVLASGAQKFANDIQWARMYLVNAGLLEPLASAGRGNWKLTPEGWAAPLSQVSAEEIYNQTAKKGKSQKSDVQDAPADDSPQTEFDGMASRESVLTKILKSMTPEGFERFCAELMTNNGLIQTKPTGQTGDGGVDGEGMLPMDALALIKISVAWQCKRYAAGTNNVSSGNVRDFRGSIEGRAKYGLIFTTASFTPSAEIEARRPGATPIEMVDLKRILDLMKKQNIGVKAEEPFEVDEAYFEAFLHPAKAASTSGNAELAL